MDGGPHTWAGGSSGFPQCPGPKAAPGGWAGTGAQERRPFQCTSGIRPGWWLQCTAPHPWDRAGFSMLLASTPPSPPWAPTMVCSSSRNRITSPLASLTSSITYLRRSSNSPLNLEPATMAARSRAITRRPPRESGTSSSAIRCARPSTMSVLPTPA